MHLLLIYLFNILYAVGSIILWNILQNTLKIVKK